MVPTAVPLVMFLPLVVQSLPGRNGAFVPPLAKVELELENGASNGSTKTRPMSVKQKLEIVTNKTVRHGRNGAHGQLVPKTAVLHRMHQTQPKLGTDVGTTVSERNVLTVALMSVTKKKAVPVILMCVRECVSGLSGASGVTVLPSVRPVSNLDDELELKFVTEIQSKLCLVQMTSQALSVMNVQTSTIDVTRSQFDIVLINDTKNNLKARVRNTAVSVTPANAAAR